MIKEKFFLGLPYEFNKKFLIYPPKIKDIVGNDDYSKYRSLFTISQEEIEDELVEKIEKGEAFPTPFEFLLGNAYHNEDFMRIAQEAFEFFIHQEVTILCEQKLVLIGNLVDEMERVTDVEQLVFLTEEEYFDFQNCIRIACGMDTVKPPVEDEDPRVKHMKAMARYRDKIKEKNGEGLNFLTSLTSICCMEIGLNPLNIGEMPYAALSDLTARFQEKEKYHIDIESIQAGAEAKKVNPKYWIRNLVNGG